MIKDEGEIDQNEILIFDDDEKNHLNFVQNSRYETIINKEIEHFTVFETLSF
jgi:hypothetical protein